MTNRFLAISALALGAATSAEAGYNTASFNDVGLTAPDSYYNAFAYNAGNGTFQGYENPTTAYPNGRFSSGGTTFTNSYGYYPGYGGYFSGFAVSDQTTSSVTPYVNQKTTPDVNYEYISAAGSGANGAGSPFAVVTSGTFVNLTPGSSASSVQVTNSLYNVYSITNGDTFATAFAPGNFFNLMISGYTGLNGTGSMIGSAPIIVPLATDTVGTDSQGNSIAVLSILETWMSVDLTGLASAKSLVFKTMSNDNNAYGDAIPSLFDLDNFSTFTPSVVPEPSSLILCIGGLAIGSLALRRSRARKVLS